MRFVNGKRQIHMGNFRKGVRPGRPWMCSAPQPTPHPLLVNGVLRSGLLSFAERCAVVKVEQRERISGYSSLPLGPTAVVRMGPLTRRHCRRVFMLPGAPAVAMTVSQQEPSCRKHRETPLPSSLC